MSEQMWEPPRVLVVEDQADVPVGHFPCRFAELAEAFAALGCGVEVLTSRGWVHARDSGTVHFDTSRYGIFALLLDRIGRPLQRLRGKRRAQSRVRYLGGALRVVAMIATVRVRRQRRAGRRADVVVLSQGIDPLLAATIAGPGHWLFYLFDPQTGSAPGHLGRLLARIAEQAERRRRGHGDSLRVATPDEASRERWEEIAPFLNPTVLPIAGCRVRDPIPGARQRLGLLPGTRLALLFGSPAHKDCEVVWRAFENLSEWRLVIAGQVADLYASSTPPPSSDHDPFLMGGFLDDITRSLIYSAADLIVLSFHPNHRRNSGTLMDAISWGVPVVCSEQSAAADLVQDYRLGVTFKPGDPQSLAASVRTAPARIAPEDLQRAHRELSNRAVASLHLQALQQSGE
jgi:glycosyltransferase involved in cell wall biosynthesis